METTLWVVGRATGIISLMLMTVSVVLGILNRSGRPALGLPRFAVTLVHRNASLIGSILVLIHIVSLFFDPYAQLTLVDYLVPFLGSYQPFWQGLGTVAFDLLLAIVVTSLLRARLGVKAFRVVHWFTYLMWPIALFHAIGNGSDSSKPWFIAIAVVCSASVVSAVGWRLSKGFLETSGTRLEQVR